MKLKKKKKIKLKKKKKKKKKRRDPQIGYLCKKYGSAGRFTIFGTYVFKSNLEHF
jgi:hypothetical protein